MTDLFSKLFHIMSIPISYIPYPYKLVPYIYLMKTYFVLFTVPILS